jgi:phage/plasmid-associated DNA primase
MGIDHGSTDATVGVDFLRGGIEANKQAHARLPNSPPESPLNSEDAIALEFAQEHAGRLHFVKQWNTWLEWTGQVWCRDQTQLAFDLSRQTCRQHARHASAKDQKRIASASGVAAVAKMAGADRLIASTADAWDQNPNLLNTPDGTVDLSTGKIHPHDSINMITKITAVAPAGDCPRWLKFLDEITGSNQPLVDYLQRAVGYALTGLTVEHALFFLHGTGAN